MVCFNGHFERLRQTEMTPDKIMAVARSKGEFSVSLRYRDDWLRRRCGKLKSQGLLVGGRRQDRAIVFYPAAHPQPQENPNDR